MLIVPLQAVPSQEINVLLANQNCQVVISQKSTGLYCDLYVNNSLIIGGVKCQNLNRIVRSTYLGFIGDLMFGDTEGEADPDYTGLGGRFKFIYLSAADLEAAEAA